MPVIDLLDKTKYLPAPEVERRKQICAACPQTKMAGLQCGVCKCLINLKAKLKTEKCPIGQW